MLLEWLITALVADPYSANPWYILTLVSAIAFLGGSCLTAAFLSLIPIAQLAEGYPAKLLNGITFALLFSGAVIMMSLMAVFDDVLMPGPLWTTPMFFPFLLWIPLSSPGRQLTWELLVALVKRVKTTE